MTENDSLSRKQEKAIGALLSEPTILMAAEKLGMAEITLHRWLKEKRFVTAYRAACKRIVEGSIGRLQAACGEAVETLSTIMADPLVLASSRVSAARTVLDTALKAVELHDLEERIRQLEEWTELGRRT